ncbi:FliO/MopB family protein [Azospirillum rugosum]|uniref:Flagellar protein FliO/FliZ n=1 Tax=Azospirillum rugosum TaxID=416170 RepID=A0ABS4SLW8_9PROT|nr:flagellar biosynthetic protein FliO [Azospirillum rugosum]MBP2293564.1 flagellar protein FliO/FliZ [Azospirillum rugosum]MDQ0529243.1 flagellar protein FliO/FliZ [Azospirillum rugosum]
MDLDQYIRFIVALLFVIALIMVVAWVMRRVGFGGLVSTPSRQRRLGVVEVLPLDGKRRLVLVRRDDQEHLLLLSAFGDTVVDGGIRPGGGFRGALVEAAGPAQSTEPRP